MDYFLPFFLVLFASVFSSIFFRKLHLPWVVALIIGGVVIGPTGFDVFVQTPVMEFFGQVGLIFLMFMAGLETNLSNFKSFGGKFSWLAFINGLIPFLVGYGVTQYFGYSTATSVLVGAIFVSSSVSVVIPALESSGIIFGKLGQSVVITTVLQDIASLTLISFILQKTSPLTSLPLALFYLLMFAFMFFIRWLLPKLKWLVADYKTGKSGFEQEVRVVFLALFGIVILFQLIGLHPIVVAFYAELVLSGSVTDKVLIEKIHTIAYGVFIPAFFIVVGTQTNLGIFRGIEDYSIIWIFTLIILGSALSKFVSGYLGSRMIGFKKMESVFFGVTSMPQLSSTLAVTLTGLSIGLLDQTLVTSLVALTIITSTIAPFLMNWVESRL